MKDNQMRSPFFLERYCVAAGRKLILFLFAQLNLRDALESDWCDRRFFVVVAVVVSLLKQRLNENTTAVHLLSPGCV